MRIIVFKTENAVFEFSRKDILEHLNLLATEHDGDETVRLRTPGHRSLRVCPLRIHISFSGLAGIFWGCSIDP